MKKFFLRALVGVLLGAVVYGGVRYWQTYNTPAYEKLWGWFPTTKFIPLWERKVQTDQVLKIGLITDTQVHPNRIRRSDKRPDAPRYLGSSRDARPLALFNERMKEYRPDIIVHAGDVIEGTGDSDIVGIMGMQLVEKELAKSGVPIYWVLGNHELRSLTKEQWRETMRITPQFRDADQVVDIGDYRLIFLDANYYPDGRTVEPGGKRHIPGYLHPETLAWLERQLDTDKRVFVFMHQGAFDKPVRQWQTFDVAGVRARVLEAKRTANDGKKRRTPSAPDYGPGGKLSITNAQDLRALMAKYNVDAFFNGHLEVARYEEADGVRYYSFAGTKKSKTFQESFYEVTITGAVPDVTMYYTDQVDFSQKILDFEDALRVTNERR